LAVKRNSGCAQTIALRKGFFTIKADCGNETLPIFRCKRNISNIVSKYCFVKIFLNKTVKISHIFNLSIESFLFSLFFSAILCFSIELLLFL